ncbi:hypothetical protein KKG45_04910 [bacterium]|nr:hypothetical protein [bacterium]MBU1072568.1 hypothetical protein [bacterium]MBU1495042.1 hypothetical protein [Actinomycetota bacterium]MBU1674693.1 hypothetical protein [bacterium]
MNNVTRGLDHGVQVGYFAGPAIVIGVGYSRLACSTGYADASGSEEYNLPADIYEIHFTILPPGEKKVRFGFGANLGLIQTAGTAEIRTPGEDPITGDFSGRGLLLASF